MGAAWGVRAVECDLGLDLMEEFKSFCEDREAVVLSEFWAYLEARPLARCARDGEEDLCRILLYQLSAELVVEYLDRGCISYKLFFGEVETPRTVEVFRFGPVELQQLERELGDSDAITRKWRGVGDEWVSLGRIHAGTLRKRIRDAYVASGENAAACL